MGRQRKQNRPFKPEDYNATTEPVERVILPAYVPPGYYGADDPAPGALTVPAPQPVVRSVPHEEYPYHQPPQAQNAGLPPSPQQKQRGYPPGGSPHFAQPVRQYRPRRSPFPGLVGLCLFLVQLVLLARVACLVFNVQATTVWLALLFAAGDLFVEPLRLLAAYVNISLLAGTPLLTILEFLVAILAYGLLSRILVRLLKALLNH